MQLQHGFSLLEVLITLLILKLGLLGVIAGQTLALQYVIDATQRTAAVSLSSVLLQDLSATIVDHPAFTVELDSTSPAVLPLCSADFICSSTQLRNYQVVRWQQLWQAGVTETSGASLFSPQFCIQFSDNTLQLKASWQQRANASSSAEISSCEAGTGRSALAVAAGML